jgi:DNA-binding NarL/FixJ family response regulator
MPSFVTALLEGENASLEKPRQRVLVVDDFLPIRRVVCSELRNIPELEVVAEASDGLTAVQLAQELQPNLVVIDIDLPKLNGIEAARQILALSPHSKILFLSQESSFDVIQTALATGAKGYVVKMHIGKSLLIAVNAVLRGEIAVMAG